MEANLEIVKIRRTHYKITNVAIDFHEFTESFRRIRKNHRYKGFDCFNCHKDFEDGEKVSLIFTDKGNKIVCKKCAVDFEKKLKQSEEETQ